MIEKHVKLFMENMMYGNNNDNNRING